MKLEVQSFFSRMVGKLRNKQEEVLEEDTTAAEASSLDALINFMRISLRDGKVERLRITRSFNKTPLTITSCALIDLSVCCLSQL